MTAERHARDFALPNVSVRRWTAVPALFTLYPQPDEGL
jgi:hypothetical protein